MSKRIRFYHVCCKPYDAYDVYYRAATLAYRCTSRRVHPKGKVMIAWKVSPTRASVNGSTYEKKRGRHSGCVVMRIPADLHGYRLSDTAYNLALIVGTLAHEFSHIQDEQSGRRRVRRPTSDPHGTPAERDADYEEHRCLRMLVTHGKTRAMFTRLAKRLHKKGLKRHEH